MKKTLVFVGILLLIACGTAKKVTLTQADFERADKTYPGITSAELSEGKSIFESNCNQCHTLRKPANKTEEQLKKIVPRMVGKVNRRADKEVIDEKAKETLLKYLVVMRASYK